MCWFCCADFAVYVLMFGVLCFDLLLGVLLWVDVVGLMLLIDLVFMVNSRCLGLVFVLLLLRCSGFLLVLRYLAVGLNLCCY